MLASTAQFVKFATTARMKDTQCSFPRSAGAPPLVFVHANGFTPGAYRQMLAPLADNFDVRAVKLRPLCGHTKPKRDWRILVRDIGDFVDANCREAVVGVGHSVGAVTLLHAAAEQPRRFTRLVLIDPPALSPWVVLGLQVAPVLWRHRNRLYQSAVARRDRWSNWEEAFQRERARATYARIPDSVLRDILNDGLIPHPEGGVTLRFRKDWESALYESPLGVWSVLKRTLPPVRIIVGEQSRVLTPSAIDRWLSICPSHEFVAVEDAGHLVPLERPQRVAALIQDGHGRLQAHAPDIRL